SVSRARRVPYSNERQIDAAVPDCSEVIKREPKNSGGYNCLGVAYEGLKDYRRGIAAYDQSISINPKNGVAYWNRGNAYTALRKIDGAIRVYDQAIAINP